MRTRLDAASLNLGPASLSEPRARAGATVAMVAGAVLVAAAAAIHLHLWDTGYRHIPTIGPLFVFQGVVGVLIALAIVILRRVAAAVVGAGFLLSTLGGFLLSVLIGLFGFKDSFSAPDATLSMGVEILGAVVLSGSVAVILAPGLRRR